MKFVYYDLKYVKKIRNGFGGVTRGPFIYILNKYKDDIGLLEHEKFHARQFWYSFLFGCVAAYISSYFLYIPLNIFCVWVMGTCTHAILYKLIPQYRLWSEVRAYRIQIKVGKYRDNEFAVNALMNRYGLCITRNEALEKLGLKS